MAHAAEGDATVPPVTGRLLLPATLRVEVRTMAVDSHPDLVPTPVPVVRGIPIVDAHAGDVLAHGLPDVHGRLTAPPGSLELCLFVDRIVADRVVVDDRHTVRWFGREIAEPGVLASALRRLQKQLDQRRGVRPVFRTAPPLGVPVVTPLPVPLPDWVTGERPMVPGLADLLVVRPIAQPPTNDRMAVPRLVVP